MAKQRLNVFDEERTESVQNDELRLSAIPEAPRNDETDQNLEDEDQPRLSCITHNKFNESFVSTFTKYSVIKEQEIRKVYCESNPSTSSQMNQIKFEIQRNKLTPALSITDPLSSTMKRSDKRKSRGQKKSVFFQLFKDDNDEDGSPKSRSRKEFEGVEP